MLVARSTKMQSNSSLPKVKSVVTPAKKVPSRGGGGKSGSESLPLAPIIAIKGYGSHASSGTGKVKVLSQQQHPQTGKSSSITGTGTGTSAWASINTSNKSTSASPAKPAVSVSGNSSKGTAQKAAAANSGASAGKNAKSSSSSTATAAATAVHKELVSARALRLLAAQPVSTDNCGKVPVKFNHYNKSFPIHNGVLRWQDIDEEYAFSFVYKGNYSKKILFIPEELRKPYKAMSDDLVEMGKDENSEFFLGLISAGEYVVQVVEDASAGVGIDGIELRAGPLVLSSNTEDVKSGNLQMKLLTNELKSLDPKSLQSAEAKDLIEKRDLEDILYSKA